MFKFITVRLMVARSKAAKKARANRSAALSYAVDCMVRSIKVRRMTWNEAATSLIALHHNPEIVAEAVMIVTPTYLDACTVDKWGNVTHDSQTQSTLNALVGPSATARHFERFKDIDALEEKLERMAEQAGVYGHISDDFEEYLDD